MAQLHARTTLPVSADEAFAWHLRPGALERLNPPWEPARILARSGALSEDTARVTLGMPMLGPARMRWEVRHDGFDRDRHRFRDVMERGPFAQWEHTHRVEARGIGTSALHDVVDYRLPVGRLGAAFGSAAVRAKLVGVFAYRHHVTRGDLAAHERARDLLGHDRPLRIAVTGASGLIGSALVAYLLTAGHRVVPLQRPGSRGGMPESFSDAPALAEPPIEWDPAAGTIDAARLEGLDAVVHLAGESVAGLWTGSKRQAIRDSRVNGTALLARTLARLDAPPAVFVSTSAAGWYGDRGREELREDATRGSGFLAEVVRAWEAAADPARAAGVRVVHPRIGIVLDPRGGALKALLPAFRAGVGGRIGRADDVVSWILLEDVVSVLEHCIAAPDVEGPVNVAAPAPVTWAGLARALGRVLHRPAALPVPERALRLALGDFADEALLTSAHLRVDRLLATDYGFRWTQLEPALRHMLGRGRPPEELRIREGAVAAAVAVDPEPVRSTARRTAPG